MARIFVIGFNNDKKMFFYESTQFPYFTFDTGIFTCIIPNYLQKRLKNTAPVYLQDFTNCFRKPKKGALVIMHEVFSASCLLTRFEQLSSGHDKVKRKIAHFCLLVTVS